MVFQTLPVPALTWLLGLFYRKNMQRNKQVAMGRKKFNMDPKKVRAKDAGAPGIQVLVPLTRCAGSAHEVARRCERRVYHTRPCVRGTTPLVPCPASCLDVSGVRVTASSLRF